MNFEIKKKQIESLKNCNLQSVLNKAFEILGNPLMMFDTSYNLLGYTENCVTDDPLWNELLASKTFSHNTVNFFNQENFINDYAKSETGTLMKSSKLKYDRYNVKLFDKNNMQFGSTIVISCFKPFDEADFELIENICEILSVKIQQNEKYKKIDLVYNETFLNTLIEKDDIKKTAELRKSVATFYHGLKSNLYVAVIDISRFDKTVTHLAYCRDIFKQLQSEYYYFIHLYNVIAIISINSEVLSEKKHLKKLNSFFSENNITAGISSKFDNLFELKKYHCEAINALNYGLKSQRTNNIFFYDSFRVEHFLNTAKESFDINEIFSPVIPYMQSYDAEHRTNYFELLKTYLSFGQNCKATAKMHNLSASQFKAKMKQIENLFNIDFSNGDMMLNLFTSIKML